MSDEPLRTIAARPGDPLFDGAFGMMEAMRAAIEPLMEGFADPRDAMTAAMTAASMFSGAQAGTLMSIGAFKSQDKRRLVDAASTNFRNGMAFGLNRGLRIGAEQIGGSA